MEKKKRGRGGSFIASTLRESILIDFLNTSKSWLLRLNS